MSHRSRAPAVVASLALVALVVAFTAGPLRAAVTAPRVAVVGDSLTNQASYALNADLAVHGYQPSATGLNGAAVDQMRPQLASAVSPGGRADIVVAALGTNNAFYATVNDGRHRDLARSQWDIAAAMNDVLDGPGPDLPPSSARCLVWVNINDHVPDTAMAEAATQLNATIDAQAAAHRARGQDVVVVDFAGASRDQPGWFLPDGIHLTGIGESAYARLIRHGVDQCRV